MPGQHGFIDMPRGYSLVTLDGLALQKVEVLGDRPVVSVPLLDVGMPSRKVGG